MSRDILQRRYMYARIKNSRVRAGAYPGGFDEHTASEPAAAVLRDTALPVLHLAAILPPSA